MSKLTVPGNRVSRKIILFGASTRGRDYLQVLRSCPDVRVECFVDNAPDKWGTLCEGIPVRQPSRSLLESVDVVLVSSSFVEEIFQQLVSLGAAAKTALSLEDFSNRFASDQASTAIHGREPRAHPDLNREEIIEWIEGETTADAREFIKDFLGRREPRAGSLRATQDGGAPHAICTICSNNYLAHARTLTESYLRQHPDSRVFICLADERLAGLSYPDREDSRVRIVECRELKIPHFDAFRFRYNQLEFNCAVKPFLLDHLLATAGVERLVYMDPDILVLRPIERIFDELKHHTLALIPHITSPITDAKSPGEVDILKSGTFNLGFLGVANTTLAGNFLRWWRDRLLHHCTVEPDRGLFVDQKWLDLVPSLWDSYVVLRNPGYNVAYWNLQERIIRFEGGRFRANGAPLSFFHFSGFEFFAPERVSKHQNRFTTKENRALQLLFEIYRFLLLQNGYLDFNVTPYAFGRFDNGVPLSDIIRRVYRSDPDLALRFPNPFDTSVQGSYFSWLNEPVKPGYMVTNLLFSLHRIHYDGRCSNPRVLEQRATDMILGILASCGGEFKLDARFYTHLIPRLVELEEGKAQSQREEVALCRPE